MVDLSDVVMGGAIEFDFKALQAASALSIKRARSEEYPKKTSVVALEDGELSYLICEDQNVTDKYLVTEFLADSDEPIYVQNELTPGKVPPLRFAEPPNMSWVGHIFVVETNVEDEDGYDARDCIIGAVTQVREHLSELVIFKLLSIFCEQKEVPQKTKLYYQSCFFEPMK